MKMSKNKFETAVVPGHLMEIILDREKKFDIIFGLHHEVYPNIIIGGKCTALNKAMLAELEVTHVLNCAQGNEYGFVNTDQNFYKDMDIHFNAIQARDKIGFSILPYLRHTSDFIHQALQDGGKVYVHCCSGYSRAPTVVTAYLMIHKQMDVRDALYQVRSKRRVAPNHSFREQLCQLNAELFSIP